MLFTGYFIYYSGVAPGNLYIHLMIFYLIAPSFIRLYLMFRYYIYSFTHKLTYYFLFTLIYTFFSYLHTHWYSHLHSHPATHPLYHHIPSYFLLITNTHKLSYLSYPFIRYLSLSFPSTPSFIFSLSHSLHLSFLHSPSFSFPSTLFTFPYTLPFISFSFSFSFYTILKFLLLSRSGGIIDPNMYTYINDLFCTRDTNGGEGADRVPAPLVGLGSDK